MLGPAVFDPLVRPWSLKTGFGRDQKIGRIWMQRLGDETLGDYGPVGIGGVDEVDSQLHRATQDGDRLVMIFGFPPDTVAGELHCTEAQSANGNVATDQECSARFSRAYVRRRSCRTHIYMM